MFSSRHLDITFRKGDYKHASFFNKYISNAWADPAINSANLKKDLTLRDCPDMFEKADDISDKVTEFAQNYAFYAKTNRTRPFLRAFLYTFRRRIIFNLTL
jgi:hypothetical protein